MKVDKAPFSVNIKRKVCLHLIQWETQSVLCVGILNNFYKYRLFYNKSEISIHSSDGPTLKGVLGQGYFRQPIQRNVIPKLQITIFMTTSYVGVPPHD